MSPISPQYKGKKKIKPHKHLSEQISLNPHNFLKKNNKSDMFITTDELVENDNLEE